MVKRKASLENFLKAGVEPKKEFYDGHELDRLASDANHETLVKNLHFYLRRGLVGSQYRVHQDDLLVAVSSFNVFTFPDLVVAPKEPEFHEKHEHVVANPIAAIEVVSTKEPASDRAQKFYYYRALPSLKTITFVDRDSMLIEHYIRVGNGEWRFFDLNDKDAFLQFEALELEMDLDALYEGVKF